MNSFFARHEVDKKAEGFEIGEDGFPSAGRIAWRLWGGDPGQSWAAKKVKEIEGVRQDLSDDEFDEIFNSLEGEIIDEKEWESALEDYYRLCDWDVMTGHPSLKKMESLGLGWVVAENEALSQVVS